MLAAGPALLARRWRAAAVAANDAAGDPVREESGRYNRNADWNAAHQPCVGMEKYQSKLATRVRLTVCRSEHWGVVVAGTNGRWRSDVSGKPARPAKLIRSTTTVVGMKMWVYVPTSTG